MWYNTQKIECIYCGIDEDLSIKLFSKRLCIDRKDNSKGYTLDNIVLACHKCNLTKSNWFTFDEMKKIGEMFIKPKMVEIKEIICQL